MTISRKLLLILAVLVTLILVVSTTLATFSQSRLLHSLFNEKVSTVSTQLAAATQGALKWGQSSAAEKVYTDFTTSVADSRLEAFFAIKADGSTLWEHNEDQEHYEFIKKYLAKQAEDGETPKNHVFEESDHVAVLNSIINPETQKLIGTTITFWNNDHLTGLAIKQALFQGGVGFILLLLGLGALTFIIRSILVAPVHALVRMASQLAAKLDASMSEVSRTTSEMSSNAQHTTQKTSAVMQNSSQTAANVQQVAAGAEQLSSSLVGVSHTVDETGQLVEGAIQQANASREVIASLSQASQNISQVTNMIAEIAGQTNLLALNASIEAARAGDAGRGFAVVADEIKKLATTTTQATADITNQVKQMAITANSSSEALQNIAGSVQRINEQTNIIRTAVNEQSGVTQDITRNMHEASTHVQEVDHQLADVSQAANATGEMSSQLLERINGLKSDSDKIVLELKKFGQQI